MISITMKKTIITIVLLFFGVAGFAQEEEKKDTTWTLGGEAAISFSQASFENWASGGENAIAGNGLLNLSLNFEKKKSKWTNNLELAYGLVKTGDLDVRKSQDKIDFSSKYGYEAFENWYYSALANFKTQFTEGYEYFDEVKDSAVVISDFFAPAYLITGIGMDYNPNDNFSTFISPVTMKATYVTNSDLSDAGDYGVDEGEKSRYEFGATIRMFHKKEIVENVDFQNKLELFSNYSNKPQNIDVNWELLIVLQVNKFLTANVNTQLIYDDDVIQKVQFREVIGVGFNYQF